MTKLSVLRGPKKRKWSVETLQVSDLDPGKLPLKKAAYLEAKLQEIEDSGRNIFQVTETCLSEGKIWSFTIMSYA